MCLRYEFEPVRIQILRRTSLSTFTEALVALIAKETCLCALTTTLVMSHAVLVVPHQTGVIRAHSFANVIVYTHYKKTGHHAKNCFKLHPKQLVKFQVKRSTGSHHKIVTGASSYDPLIRVYGSATSMSASGITVSSWVLNSGALFHITSNGSQLSSCRPTPDGMYIQTTDGTSFSFTHQGILTTSQFTIPNVSLGCL